MLNKSYTRKIILFLFINIILVLLFIIIKPFLWKVEKIYHIGVNQGSEFSLGYKLDFISGLYVEDKGYVLLDKVGGVTEYDKVLFNNYQKSGYINTPLPNYNIGFLNYLFGSILLIIIEIIIIFTLFNNKIIFVIKKLYNNIYFLSFIVWVYVFLIIFIVYIGYLGIIGYSKIEYIDILGWSFLIFFPIVFNLLIFLSKILLIFSIPLLLVGIFFILKRIKYLYKKIRKE